MSTCQVRIAGVAFGTNMFDRRELEGQKPVAAVQILVVAFEPIKLSETRS